MSSPNVKYFSKVTQDYWTPKNNLHVDIKKFVRRCEKLVLPPLKVDKFIQNFHHNICKISSAHPKCKPVIIDHWVDEKGDIILNIPGVSHFILYRGKEFEDA